MDDVLALLIGLFLGLFMGGQVRIWFLDLFHYIVKGVDCDERKG